MNDRPQVTPELLARFRAYHDKHSAWGVLHVVLDDCNYGDDMVQWSIEFAAREQDDEGMALAIILRGLTRTQRRKITVRA